MQLSQRHKTTRHVVDIHHSSVTTTAAHRQHEHRVSPSYTTIEPLYLYFIIPLTYTLF